MAKAAETEGEPRSCIGRRRTGFVTVLRLRFRLGFGANMEGKRAVAGYARPAPPCRELPRGAVRYRLGIFSGYLLGRYPPSSPQM